VKRDGTTIEEPASVLDSDQLVQALPRTSTTHDPNPYLGRVVYTHGRETDQPLALALTRYDYVDFAAPQRPPQPPQRQHLLLFGLVQNVAHGGKRPCRGAPPGYASARLWWPVFRCPLVAGFGCPLRPWYAYNQDPFRVQAFQGTLIQDKADATRTYYRRNRSYDPTSGRFTQEDPIGLAGGLNLYGFANGDPVNFSDPFGLCVLALPCPIGIGIGGLSLGGPPGWIAAAGLGAGMWLNKMAGNSVPSTTPGVAGAADATAMFAGRSRSKNDIPLVGGPPNGILTKPGTSVIFGPDGNAVTRTCAQSGHGCEGAHTHDYVTGPNGKVNQKGQPRPATEDEKKRTPPPNP